MDGPTKPRARSLVGTLSREEPPVATRALGPKNGEPPAVAVHETRPPLLLCTHYLGHKLNGLRLGVPRSSSAGCKHALASVLVWTAT